MVQFVCSACKAVRYCTTQCQIQDWSRHGCTFAPTTTAAAAIGAPVGSSAPGSRIIDLLKTADAEALAWMKSNLHLYKDTAEQKKDNLRAAGLISLGADAFVLAVAQNGYPQPTLAGVSSNQAMILKVGMADGDVRNLPVSAQQEVAIHWWLSNRLRARTTHNGANSRSLPVPDLYANWVVFTPLRSFMSSFHEKKVDPLIVDALVGVLARPDTDVGSAPVHMTCALMERLNISLAAAWDKNPRWITHRLIDNVCAHVAATLAVLTPAGFTHNDLHPGNVYIAQTTEKEARFIRYKVPPPSGRAETHLSVRLLHNPFPVEEGERKLGIVRGRVAVADFGRSCMRGQGQDHDLGLWLGWPPDLREKRGVVNWPNYGNPGYDMWVLACFIVMRWTGEGPVPRVVEAMVPGPVQIAHLVEALAGDDRAPALVAAFKAVRLAVDDKKRLVDAANLLKGDSAHLWRIPWAPRFFKAPSDVLEAAASWSPVGYHGEVDVLWTSKADDPALEVALGS